MFFYKFQKQNETQDYLLAFWVYIYYKAKSKWRNYNEQSKFYDTKTIKS